jgi:4-hydroxy-tetrahydrodipicolinate reductase
MPSLNIAIAGSGGRMGRVLIETLLKSPDLKLAAALERRGDANLGKDAGAAVGAPCGVQISDDVERVLAGCDALVDFTRPEGTLEYLDICRRLGVCHVIGTTGFTPAEKESIALSARDVPVALAPNFSVGVNVAFRLLDMAARVLNDGYDVEVVEAHHKHKIDAPSGTALRMGEVVAEALGRNLKECAIYGREGVTGERDSKTIGFSTIRGGDIVGDHTVMFIGAGERLEITHRSWSRANYAEGAFRAARFLRTKKSGLFDMWDVLGLR